MDGTVKVESGVIVIENKYFKEGQNVEVYTKPYTGANQEDNKPTIYTWAEFKELKIKETDAEGNEVEVPVVEYVKDKDGNIIKIKFNVGKYMEATEGIAPSDKLTIRFVTPAKPKMKSANAFSFLYSNDEMDEEMVAEYEEQFKQAEQGKASTITETQEEKEKTTENNNTENENVGNNTTENTEKEDKDNTVENTETNSGNETTKPEETPNKPEPTTPETNNEEQNTVVESDAE